MPLVTLILVTLNVAVYGLFGSQAACEAFGLIPAHLEPASLVTYGFLHDPTGWEHLVGNMAFLLVFGAIVEREAGGLLLVVLYGLAGAAGGLLHAAAAPGATIPLVGASGAVFGVLAVSAAIRPRLLGFVLAFGGWEVYRALEGAGSAVSAPCHIGGLVAGVLVAMALRAAGSDALEAA